MTPQTLLSITMAATLSCLGTAQAQQPLIDTIDPGARALLKVVSPNIEVIRKFDGPPGLDGYVIKEGGTPEDPVVVWLTKDNRHLIAGNIIDQHGRNLTEISANAYGVRTPIEQIVNISVDAVLSRIEEATGSNMALTPGPQEGTTPSVDSLVAKALPQDKKDELISQMSDSGSQGFSVTDPAVVASAVGGVRALRNKGMTIPAREAKPGQPMISVYFDPNCVPCQNLVQATDKTALDSYNGAGFEWIPVSLLGNDRSALYVVDQKSVAAVEQSVRPGGLANIPDSFITTENKQTLSATNQVLEDSLVSVTPIGVIDFRDGSATIMIGVTPDKIRGFLDKQLGQ